jgi:hypothetical protein
MRIVLAVAAACLTMGSWHWPARLTVAHPATGADVVMIYTGTLTLGGRRDGFSLVKPGATL